MLGTGRGVLGFTASAAAEGFGRTLRIARRRLVGVPRFGARRRTPRTVDVTARFAALLIGALLAALASAPPSIAAQPTTWTRLKTTVTPHPNESTEITSLNDESLAFDPQYGLVVAGGESAIRTDVSYYVAFAAETGFWNGSIFTEFQDGYTKGEGLFETESASMAYDPATKQLIYFGGAGRENEPGTSSSYIGQINATLVYNGKGWTHLHPAKSPPVRDGASMAWDPATGQLLLFGGAVANECTNLYPEKCTPELYNDTWEWNGNNWIELRPATAPTPLSNAAMAYQPGVGLILFGGQTPSGSLKDDDASQLTGVEFSAWEDGACGCTPLDWTYVWAGGKWTKLSPATSPPATIGGTMAYDPDLGEVVLFGGTGPSPWKQYAVGQEPPYVWAFNGTTWEQLASSSPPPDLDGAALEFDGTTDQLLLLGGITHEPQYNQQFRSNHEAEFWILKTVPRVPVITNVTTGDQQLTVGFKAPSLDGGSPITGYEVRVNDAREREHFEARGTATPITVTGLPQGDPDTVEVRAFNAVGASAWATAPGTYTPAPAAPTAPDIVEARPESGTFTSHGRTYPDWFAVLNAKPPASDNGASIEKYQVECTGGVPACSPGVFEGTYSASGFSHLATQDLSVGEVYEFRVRVKNSAGWSAWSNTSNTVAAGRAPEKPEGVSVTAGVGNATVSIGIPLVAPEPPVTYRVVAINESNGQEETEAESATAPVKVSGLTNGASYQLRVYACNIVAEYEASGCPSTTIYGVVAGEQPGAPTVIGAEAGDGHLNQARVFFFAPASQGAPAGSSFWAEACQVREPADCEWATAPAHATSQFQELSITVPNLENGVEYKIRVSEENTLGEGPPSAWSETVTPGLEPTIGPASVSELTQEAGSVEFTINPNYVAVIECEVTYTVAGAASYTTVPCASLPPAGTSPIADRAHLTGLAANTEYEFEIRAASEDGTTEVFGGTFTTLFNSATGDSTSPTGSAVATDTAGTLTATALTGEGTVGAGQYAGVPASLSEQLTFRAGSYFDVFLSAGNSFEEVQFKDCELYGAKEVKWYNPTGLNPHTGHDTGAWQTVSSETYEPGPPACVSVRINSGSSPSLSQMSGTVFSAAVPAGPAPTVTKLSAKKGPAAGGTPVTLTGTGFAGAARVNFGTVAVHKITYISATEITAATPAGTTGPVAVTVTTANGTSSPSSKATFTFEAPTVTGLSTRSGPKAGGTSLTVTGTGFAPGAGLTTFAFGKISAGSVDCSSTTTCTLISPAASKTGVVDVLAKVGTKKSKKSPSTDQFTYI